MFVIELIACSKLDLDLDKGKGEFVAGRMWLNPT